MIVSESPKIDLLNIDCMEYMAGVPDKYFDLAIVDPPYRDENQPTKDMRRNGSMESIKGRPQKDYFDELKRVTKNRIIWGANNFEADPYKGFVVWRKITISEDFTMSMCEIASISEGIGTTSKYFEHRPQDTNRIHPNQKPVKLYRWLLKNYAKEGDKILDTHGGSMSSAIACHQMGFDLTLCELDKDYYEAGVKRFREQTMQQSLFKP